MRAQVRSLSHEPPQRVDWTTELAEVVEAVASGQAAAWQIAIEVEDHVLCTVPRNGLRVALYSLLD